MSNRLHANIKNKKTSHINSAIWMAISCVCIYVIGIYVGATVVKLSWVRPFFSALAIAMGIFYLNLRRITRYYECEEHLKNLYDDIYGGW